MRSYISKPLKELRDVSGSETRHPEPPGKKYRITFDRKNQSKGHYIIAFSGVAVRVVGLHEYIVGEQHLALLKKEGIPYRMV